ncbi:MAG: chromosome segregation protein ScpA [Erysipelotrichia bacterium]|nr:chromosome segregation protein ScpA [Erysipelotrichia bacterium]
MEEFTVAIAKFDGPLDLMLHLIKEKELDLFDLDVNILTDQYIAYLNAMNEMHLEVASEYLVELAELVEYKSRKLLPKDESELGDDYEEDPKDRLVKRLLEYQQYKEVSAQLNDLYLERQEQLAKPMSGEAEQWVKNTENQPYEGNPNDLLRAMRRVLLRMQLSLPIETRYTAREISMEDRELEVRAKLDHLPSTFRFENLLDDCKDVPMFIATFLAVLDLARLHSLVFTVDENDVIWFSKGAMRS